MGDERTTRSADEPSGEDSQREERLGALVNEFFDRQQRGDGVTVEAFLRTHPEYADELREHFDGLALLGRLGGGSSKDETLPRVVLTGAVGGSSSEGTGGPGNGGAGLPEISGYEVVREVGRGGMGVVYKAIQRSTKRVVALKVLLEGPFASEMARRRFEREIELAAQLRHSNIIPIYDSGRCGGRMFYAMEYVHGRPLTEFCRAHALSLEQRLRLFVRICAAVNHAHLRGVVHRDLKPANILVDSDGEPRVHDFGLAKLGGVQDTQTSMTAQIIGTPAYMAPEQVAGDPTAIDQRTDVYSLGVILFEMITGQMPYPTDVSLSQVLNHITQTEPARPSRLNPKVPADLDTIAIKALAKRKDQRYQSVSELGSDVDRYLSGQPISARPMGTIYLLRKALWPHRYLVATLAVSVTIVLAGSYLLMRNWKSMAAHEQQRQQMAADLESVRRQVQEKDDELRRRDQEIALLMKLVESVPATATDAARRAQTGARDLFSGLGQKDPRVSLFRSGFEAVGGLGDFIAQNMPDVSAPQPAEQAASRPAADQSPVEAPESR